MADLEFAWDPLLLLYCNDQCNTKSVKFTYTYVPIHTCKLYAHCIDRWILD